MRRPSWLTLLIALDLGALVFAGIAFATLGHPGCRDRGDCGGGDDLLLTVIGLTALALPLLLAGAAAIASYLPVRRSLDTAVADALRSE